MKTSGPTVISAQSAAVAVSRPVWPPTEETVEEAIAEAVRGYRQVFGENLAQVWLFGSRATGTHRPDSDVDLLVVLHRPVSRSEEWERLSSVAHPMWSTARVYIDGHTTTTKDLDTEDDDFHYFVREEGRRVDA